MTSVSSEVNADKNDRHFRTDHLIFDLKGRSVRGGMSTLSAQICKFALSMGSTMILARLLRPADFGLVAMVTAVMGLVAMFKDAGLSDATVQSEHITHEQVSTLFWINIGLSILIMIVMAALAPAISQFYRESRLTLITMVIAGTFIFSGLTVQHQALLRRQMRFKELAIIDVVTMFIGIIIGTSMAALTKSYWSLVVIPATSAFAIALSVWIVSGWIPGTPKRATGIIPMLKFGGNLTAFNGLCYLVANADNVLIGWAWGAGPLGLYSKAYQLGTLPLRQLQQPITAVAIPALCRLQSDSERFRKYYGKAMEASVLLTMPLVTLFAVTADLLVEVVLGPRWAGTALIFIALSPGAFLDTFNHATSWALLPNGQVNRHLRWQIFASPIMVAAFAIGLSWGPIGVASAYSVARWVKRIPALWFAYRKLPMRLADVLWGAIWRPSLACLVSGSIVLLVRWTIEIEMYPFFTLFFYGAIFAITYLSVLICMPHSRKTIKDLFSVVFREHAEIESIGR